MSAAVAARALSACPSWCEEPAGHRDIDEDEFEDPTVRTHRGQLGLFEIAITEGHSDLTIARYRREYGAEKVAELTAPTVDLFLESRGRDIEGPAALRQLAEDALKAAEWLESQ
ncbi:hypothetical protein ABT304_21030 [Nocardioides sp. NPDC000445]|uniref:hypothetical protein n=1 Tax=Nocardioides sp. NPDC000445 TaxID=3154257 RepID=UPI00331E3DF3